MPEIPKLSHENLEVYQKSIRFLALSAKLMTALPRGHAELMDQLKRAALSVPLNIAEASGRTGSLDNAKHFSIARGSALECGAIVDACKALDLIGPQIYDEAKKASGFRGGDAIPALYEKVNGNASRAMITIRPRARDKDKDRAMLRVRCLLDHLHS